MMSQNRTVVLIPCYNEELTVAQVVKDFRAALPEARIHVFDNNSTDKTAQLAREAGAIVTHSPRQGKGNVMRHMFNVIDADIYVCVDGDSTYPANQARRLIDELINTGADMVIGTRISKHEELSFRRFHKFGNIVITGLIRGLFGVKVTDVLSGYRVFSRPLVKSLPLFSEGFEIETELTLQVASKGFLLKEFPIEYGSRPPGSVSKLDTYSDGFLILKLISVIFKDYKPLFFFTGLAAFFAVASLFVGFFPIRDYYYTQYVEHVPLAILAAGLGVVAVLCMGVGLILDSAHKYHRENFELWRRSK